MHKLILVIVIVIVSILVLITAVATYFFHYALDNQFKGGRSFDNPFSSDYMERINKETAALFEESKMEDVYITSHDGLRLHGYLSTAQDTHVYAIFAHGYKGRAIDMVPYARHYYDKGYNYLIFDQRAHGESEGRFITMGYEEKRDLISWIFYIISLDKDAKIILHGVSMGAATVLMATGEELPSNVVARIEDCGYTSVWDIFKDQLKELFHLPSFPLLDAASLETKLRLGFSFKEASSLDAVKRSKTPTLFIHGEDDTFVGYYMLDKLYSAENATKDILSVPGAGHAQSLSTNSELYWSSVDAFLSRFSL